MNKGIFLGVFLWLITMILLLIRGLYEMGIGVFIGMFEFAIGYIMGYYD